MSASSSDYHPSVAVRKIKNLIWLGTYFCDSIPYSIDNMDAGATWKSSVVRFKYVDILLYFQFSRISELEFRFTCMQNKKAPEGYVLRLHCVINVFYKIPMVFEMQSNTNLCYNKCWLDTLYHEHFSPNELSKKFEIKISVEMIEYDCSSNEMHVCQEEDFRLMKIRHFNYEPVLTDLCYIFHIPELKDIFTGRQNYLFCVTKNSFIRRAATFAKEIADYLRAKEACISVPPTDLAVILNFILNSERTAINNRDLLIIYFDSYYLGLHFLVCLSRDLMVTRIENPFFVIDALMTADRVNDEILFDRVAGKFHYLESQMIDPKGWMERYINMNIESRFTAYSLRRRMNKIELACREKTGTFSSRKS